MSFSYSDAEFCRSVQIVPDFEPEAVIIPALTCKEVAMAALGVCMVTLVFVVACSCVVAAAKVLERVL